MCKSALPRSNNRGGPPSFASLCLERPPVWNYDLRYYFFFKSFFPCPLGPVSRSHCRKIIQHFTCTCKCVPIKLWTHGIQVGDFDRVPRVSCHHNPPVDRSLSMSSKRFINWCVSCLHPGAADFGLSVSIWTCAPKSNSM